VDPAVGKAPVLDADHPIGCVFEAYLRQDSEGLAELGAVDGRVQNNDVKRVHEVVKHLPPIVVGAAQQMPGPTANDPPVYPAAPVAPAAFSTELPRK
jgi:hypothetical protein